MFTYENFATDNISLSSGANGTQSWTITKEGYIPIGISLFLISNATSSGVGSSYVMCYGAGITSYSSGAEKAGINYKNTSSSTAKVKFSITVAYISTDCLENISN